jgi:hypothetical protein
MWVAVEALDTRTDEDQLQHDRCLLLLQNT